MKNLIRAYKLLGSQTALAKAIGVVPQVVNNWQRRGNVPAEYCPNIERATSGQVRCEDLRPDVDWAVLRCASPHDLEAAHDELGPREHELQEAA